METSLARISLAAAVAFPVLLAAAHAAHPDLDPSSAFISEYALARHGWLMTLAFFSWGLGALTLAAVLFRARRGRAVKAGSVLLGLGACGPLLAGVFPMDVNGVETPAGMLHAVGAGLGDAMTFGAIVLSLALRRHRTAAAALGVLFVASTAAVVLEVQAGWALRLYVLATAAWVALAARDRAREVPLPASTAALSSAAS